MNIDVNLVDLINCYNKLKEKYSQLEEIEMNLFHTLSDICNDDWRDGKSLVFLQEIDSERIETESFCVNLLSKINILSFIYHKYSNLGKKVNCDLKGKESILTGIDNCIYQTKEIINSFNNMNLNYSYSEFYALRSDKQYVITLQGKLYEIKEYFSNLFYNLQSIENDIEEKMRELEVFHVNPFQFSLQNSYSISSSEGALLKSDLFTNDVSKLDSYIKDEKKEILKVFEYINSFTSFYKTFNENIYQGNLDNLNENISKIIEKRNLYLTILNQVPDLYESSANKVVRMFEGEK